MSAAIGKAVLDTNVVISAVLFAGNPRKVLQAALKGELRLFTSEPLLAELLAVLTRSKFKFPRVAAVEAVGEYSNLCQVVEPEERLKVIKADPADNRVLECAVSAGAELIISGDSHLLNLEKFRSISIISPTQFLESNC